MRMPAHCWQNISVMCTTSQHCTTIRNIKATCNLTNFLEAMFRVTVEDGLNKNSRSHLSLADAPIFKDADTIMALPEVATAYTTDLKKLTFDKTKMPLISKAVEALKKIHAILIDFEEYRISKYEK